MRYKGRGTSAYHCINRVVGGERLLDFEAREILRKMLWRVAEFSGVEVLAYCLMSNHIHILIRIPDRDVAVLSREELLRRYTVLYGEGRAGRFPEPEAMAMILADPDSEEAALWEARLRARMQDVSAFMKTLKQRFSWWYNKSHKRFGTFWAERFKSVLVENRPDVLQTVAAYIDLNPVRAGLVKDPADYRWSSYGEAMGGERCAQRGLSAAMGHADWADAAANYRQMLFGKGANGRVGEQGVIARERVLEVLSAGGKVSEAYLLRCRLRFLTDGAILGSEAFVRDTAAAAGSPSPATKALGKLPVSEGFPLRTWRKLQLSPIQ